VYIYRFRPYLNIDIQEEVISKKDWPKLFWICTLTFADYSKR
jgi:hypothetical protein